MLLGRTEQETAGQKLDGELRKILQGFYRSQGQPAVDAQTIEALKAASQAHGPYIVAAKMRILLYEGEEKPDPSVWAMRTRVNEAISHLLLTYIHDIIRESLEKENEIGPNIFATYCSEYVEASLAGPGLKTTVLNVMLLAERIIKQSIDEPSEREHYSDLALSLLGAQRTQLAAAASGAMPTPEDVKGAGKRPTPGEAADYGTACYQQYHSLRDSFGKIPADGVPSRSELKPGISAEMARAYVDYANHVVRAAESGRAFLVAGYAQEILAAMLNTVSPQDAVKQARAALENYERYGDLELGIGLISLAERRFKHAQTIAARLKDQEAHTRLAQKLQQKSATTAAPEEAE